MEKELGVLRESVHPRIVIFFSSVLLASMITTNKEFVVIVQERDCGSQEITVLPSHICSSEEAWEEGWVSGGWGQALFSGAQ